MRSRFERRIERIWYGESRLAWLLLPFSWLFGLGVTLRRLAYRAGWLRSHACPVPVIIVGNLTVGGTGKTPLVAWLVAELRQSGRHPGIVSRGYGGRPADEPNLVSASSRVADVGDEPLLLARLTGVPICVGKDRVAAARHLLANDEVDIIVADDGLQHYRLQRDLELIVIDGRRGLGNGRLLPAGPLRESRSRLAEVDLVLSNGQTDVCACVAFELVPGNARSLNGKLERSLASFAGMTVWALAGIGNPDRFYRLLDDYGIDVEPAAVADHGRVDLAGLIARHDRPILMTDKDAVKYESAGAENAWRIPVEVRMTSAAAVVMAEKLQPFVTGFRPD